MARGIAWTVRRQRPCSPSSARNASEGRTTLAYLDTSAYLKLIVDAPESEALQDALGRWPARTSSALLSVEAMRASRRLGDEVANSAEAGLTGIALVPIDDAVLAVAGRLDPRELGSLDAIHLATALVIGGDLGALFSYDERLTAAAVAAGLSVLAPA